MSPCDQHAQERQAVTGRRKNAPRKARVPRSENAIVRHEHLAIAGGEKAAAAILEHERRREQGFGGLPTLCGDCLLPTIADLRRGSLADAQRIGGQRVEARARGALLVEVVGVAPPDAAVRAQQPQREERDLEGSTVSGPHPAHGVERSPTVDGEDMIGEQPDVGREIDHGPPQRHGFVA
jgi:hypothetical protein